MINIAIDGPSGAGKGVVSAALAKKLNIFHLDTGAIYRSIGVYCFENNINPSSEQDVNAVLDKIDIEIKFDNFVQQNFVNGVLVNSKIRSLTISDYTSKVSSYILVREKVKDFQQSFAKNNNVVIEGRDIGTEIIPDTKFKFFLTASAEVRAKRRLIDLQAKDPSAKFEDVLAAIEERDYRDINREHGKLEQTKDSILINSDNLTIEQVVEEIIKKINIKD